MNVNGPPKKLEGDQNIVLTFEEQVFEWGSTRFEVIERLDVFRWVDNANVLAIGYIYGYLENDIKN